MIDEEAGYSIDVCACGDSLRHQIISGRRPYFCSPSSSSDGGGSEHKYLSASNGRQWESFKRERQRERSDPLRAERNVSIVVLIVRHINSMCIISKNVYLDLTVTQACVSRLVDHSMLVPGHRSS